MDEPADDGEVESKASPTDSRVLPVVLTDSIGARPKETPSQNGALPSQVISNDHPGQQTPEIFKEEKLKKWKQAGTALRKVISRITRSKPHKKSHSRTRDGHHVKSSTKSASKSTKSQVGSKASKKKSSRSLDSSTTAPKVNKEPSDPMNQMLEDFNQSNSTVGIQNGSEQGKHFVISSAVNRGSTSSPGRQLPSFAELKEKIRRMTSSTTTSNSQDKVNLTKKRTKILRHSRSIDASEKDVSDTSTASEQDDFLPRKPQKPLSKHYHSREKRKSIDTATLSTLHSDIHVDVSWASGKDKVRNKGKEQDSLPNLVSDSSSSGSDIPSLGRWNAKNSSNISKQTHSTTESDHLLSAATYNAETSRSSLSTLTSHSAGGTIHQTESLANLADVESCTSDGEVMGCGLCSDSDAITMHLPHDLLLSTDRDPTPTRDRSDSEASVPTLCSDSSPDDHVTGQIHKEKYTNGLSTYKPHINWPMDDGASDDDSDLFDDLPDLALHLDQMSSSEGEASPVLRLTRSDMDALPDLLSESSSSSEAEGADADDEFECDCPLCMHNRGGRSREGNRSHRDIGDAFPSLVTDSDIDESQVREFASMLLSEGRDSVLELMFQNVIIQMLSVYPDLLNEQAPPPVSPTCLDSLPTRNILANDIGEELTCPICLCVFELEEEVISLDCQHIFHTLCIRAWLAKSGTCPVCRFALRNSTS